MYDPTVMWPRHGTKRKSVITPESVPVPPPPEKHFVSEEEVAAELHRMQLGEQSFCHPTSFQYPATQTPFTFSTQGQFAGFGGYPQAQDYSSFGQMPAACSSAPLAQTQSAFPSPNQFTVFDDDDGVEIEEMDADDTRSEKKSAMPRLRVSEDLLSIKPQPALPPSLVQKISASYNMALVPYVPIKFPTLEETTEPIVTEPPDPIEDDAMID